MKKGVVIISLLVISILFFSSLSLISAGWFSDLINKISGGSITGNLIYTPGGTTSDSNGVVTITNPTLNGHVLHIKPESANKICELFGYPNSTTGVATHCTSGGSYLYPGEWRCNGTDNWNSTWTITYGVSGSANSTLVQCAKNGIWSSQDCRYIADTLKCTLPTSPSNGSSGGSNLTCTETDGGTNIYTSGRVDYTNSSGSFSISDFCNEYGVLQEYTCINATRNYSGYPFVFYSNCGNVPNLSNGFCSNGACVNTTQPVNLTCTDSDSDSIYSNGLNYYKASSGEGCYAANNNKVLYESYCKDSSGIINGRRAYICEDKCENGACNLKGNRTGNICRDYDGGINYYVKSDAFLGNYYVYPEVCQADWYNPRNNSNKNLQEVSCSEDGYGLDIETYTCPYGCSGGACVGPTPSCSENYKFRVAFANLDNVPVVSLINEDSGATICDQRKAGEECDLGNLIISLKNISYANKEVLLNVNGIIDFSFKQDKTFQIINSSSFNYDGDLDKYIVISYCGSPQICQELIDSVKNPTSYFDGINWTLNWNWSDRNNWWINGISYDFTAYHAGWSNYDQSYRYADYDIRVFDDKNAPVKDILNQFTQDAICQVRSSWDGANDREQQYYVCNWNVLTDSPNQEGDQYNSKVIYWFNDNILVNLYLTEGKYLSQEELNTIRNQELQQLMLDLKNNQNKYTWQSFDVDYPLSTHIYSSLDKCSSDIVNESYRSWYCRVEPAICPPHGEQKKICTGWDNNGKEQNIEQTISCNPGLCSGCMVPKWFGSKWSSKCIPYGFRFAQETVVGISEANEGSDHGYDTLLNITSDNSAYFKFGEGDPEGNWPWVAFEGTVYEGSIYYFYDPNNFREYKFKVRDIISSSEGSEPKIILEFIDKFDAYCDIDGQVSQQKRSDYNGEWAKCQNNYECESNLCSNGECVDTKALAQSASGFKTFIVNALCKLTNPFNSEGAYSCSIQHGGSLVSPSTTEPSSGGSGGSSA